MALETASYVANLVITNPDGDDTIAAGDDHIRLLKAVLKRQFPLADSAWSISAAQVMYLGDLSASVQLQLNQLRDGSATANNALYANSASTAANIGSIPAARVPDLAAVPVWTADEVRINNANAFYSFYNGSGVRIGYLQGRVLGGNRLLINAEVGPIEMYTNNTIRVTINADGTLTIPGLITGTITTAQTATNATTADTATNATNASFASQATFANTCTSASSAALLAGLAGASANTPNTVGLRDGSGYFFSVYFNQSSAGSESVSIGQVFAETNGDGYLRKVTPALLGSYMNARNITGKTGTAKTLASGTGPPSLTGSTNGDIWLYY